MQKLYQVKAFLTPAGAYSKDNDPIKADYKAHCRIFINLKSVRFLLINKTACGRRVKGDRTGPSWVTI